MKRTKGEELTCLLYAIFAQKLEISTLINWYYITGIVKNFQEEDKMKKNLIVAVHRRPIAVPCDRVDIGQIVLCKMRGFCEWPAIVTGFQKNLIVIKFFGDGTSHKAALRNFYKFEESHEAIIANLKAKKTPLYKKAILEAEYVLGIPEANSIITQII